MSRKAFAGAVTDTNTDVTKMGEVGDERFEGGKTYRLVYTVASEANRAFLGHATVDTLMASYSVEAATHTKPVFGYNATGASVPALSYFWAQTKGPVILHSDSYGEALSANVMLCLSSNETVKMQDSNEAFNVAGIGYSVTAGVSTTGGVAIWLDPSIANTIG